jgi:hypothetical protein
VSSAEYQREWSQRNPEKRRGYTLKSKYGITLERFDDILANQGGGCALCGAAPGPNDSNLGVDHDHRCCPGKKSCGQCVRGLPCKPCNTALGQLGDTPAGLQRALDYVDAS